MLDTHSGKPTGKGEPDRHCKSIPDEDDGNERIPKYLIILG